MAKAAKEDNVRLTVELHQLNHQVVSRLREEYERSKEVFPIEPYGLLKTMIKSAIQRSKPENQEKSFGETAATLRVKEETKRGSVHRLNYMSKEEIAADSATKSQEVQMIRDLETEYADSKGVFPFRRYFLMKGMVRKRIRRQTDTL